MLRSGSHNHQFLAQGADSDEVLEYATAAMMKKLLHSPSVRLRQAGESSEDDVVQIARELFGLSGTD